MVVHNPREGIQLPHDPNGVFAIVEIAGRQFKVTQDDLVIAEQMSDLDINQTIEINKVLLIGTKDYTAIGRPFVSDVKVQT
jgi:large subunit ribosomal protein L21